MYIFFFLLIRVSIAFIVEYLESRDTPLIILFNFSYICKILFKKYVYLYE